MTAPALSADTPLVFGTSTDDIFALNFTQFGIGTRTITTVDSVTPSPSTGAPTVTAAGPNSQTISGESGQTVAIGKAAQFRLQGNGTTVDADYVLTVKVTYSDGKKEQGVVLAQCRDR